MSFQLDTVKPFIDWLHLHPSLAGLAVFMISCAESLAIIGLVIPGSIVMPAIGSMVGAGVLPGPLVISAAILGAIVGDGVSYWLGYHYHSQIKRYWPFNRFPRLLKTGEQFFQKYGGLSVFIGRFAGPVRPIIPVVAGMMSMPPKRFLVANLSSAVAWSIVYMAPGYLLGAVSEQLAPHTAARLLVILAIFTFCVWAVWWLFKQAWHWFLFRTQRLAHRCWQAMSLPDSRWHPCYRRLAFSRYPLSHKPLLLVMAAMASLTLFIGVVFVVKYTDWLNKIDVPVYYMLRSLELNDMDYAMAVLQAFGAFYPYAVTLLAVAVYLIWRRKWIAAACWLANFVSCWLFIKLVKMATHVPRPADNVMHFSSWSFPSLYGGLIVTLLVGLVMLLLPHFHRRTWSRVVVLGAFGVSLVSLPQLYFGFNWFSDEVGGVLAAIFVGSVWMFVYHKLQKITRLKPLPLVLLASISFVASGLITAKMGTAPFLADLKVQAIQTPFNLERWWQGQALPIIMMRDNVFGDPVEPMNVQYVGRLTTLVDQLQVHGWQVAPKPSLMVILNRIGAKDRVSQLPLIPDLYQARKPLLILTKSLHEPERMLVLRLWPTTIAMVPVRQTLWLGTIQYRKPWHLLPEPASVIEGSAEPAWLMIQTDLGAAMRVKIWQQTAVCQQKAVCEVATLYIRAPHEA